MRLTRRALVVAVLVTVGTAVIWPDGAERVARVALLAVGAGVIADLVLRWQRSYPTEATAPFAPAVRWPVRPWCPQGLTDLHRDLRLMAIPAGDRRLPRSTRLRDTSRAAAQERLDPLDLDLDRPEDAPAIADLLGPEVTAFLLGESRTAPVDQLLAAVEPPVGTRPAPERAVTATPAVLSPTDAAATMAGILDELERAVVGKRAVLELVLLGLIADGHVLLDDLPGVAKTLTARSLAQVTNLSFSRIQFTPDLLPADITGATVFEATRSEFRFRPGPIFGNLVLGDEVNRAPAKTQAALLEAMQERQVTVDGTTHRLPRPFLVVATQNPIEHEGTYALPEAQLDRFLLRTRMGYPAAADEAELLTRRVDRGTDDVELTAVGSVEAILGLQAAVERVHVDPAMARYVVALAQGTRDDTEVEVGVSPRGSLALLKLARAFALARGRDFVDPDDVKAVALPALAHRVVLRSEVWVRGVPQESIIERVVASVPAPSWT